MDQNISPQTVVGRSTCAAAGGGACAGASCDMASGAMVLAEERGKERSRREIVLPAKKRGKVSGSVVRDASVQQPSKCLLLWPIRASQVAHYVVFFLLSISILICCT